MNENGQILSLKQSQDTLKALKTDHGPSQETDIQSQEKQILLMKWLTDYTEKTEDQLDIILKQQYGKPSNEPYYTVEGQNSDVPGSFGMIQRGNISNSQIKMAKKLKDLPEEFKNSVYAQERDYYDRKYNISAYKELPFCIVVPSYNNVPGDGHIRNIDSILMQNYSNFHVVLIDDHSDDETGLKVQEYLNQHRISKQKVKVIINQQRKMAMPNIYRAAKEFCRPFEIFVVVDGDDELLGRQILKLYNVFFQSNQIFVAYSNFLSNNGFVGYSRPYSSLSIFKNLYRHQAFAISHLRAFYTKLLTLVNQKDLQAEKGQWFRAGNDVAMYTPILEMAHTRIKYFSQICYFYNGATGLNNYQSKLIQQQQNVIKVRSRSPYSIVKHLLSDQEADELSQAFGNLHLDIDL